MAQKVCVLTSAGIDSSLLLWEAEHRGMEIFPLFVASGFFWEEAELFWLKRLLSALPQENLRPLRVVHVQLNRLLERHWAVTGDSVPDARSRDEEVFIPGRNSLLLTVAAIYCHSQAIGEVWIGLLKNNPFPDATAAFLKNLQGTLQEGLGRDLVLQAPFSAISKTELIQTYPDFPYHLSFSCLRPNGMEPCNACNKCAERLSHLKAAGIVIKS